MANRHTIKTQITKARTLLNKIEIQAQWIDSLAQPDRPTTDNNTPITNSNKSDPTLAAAIDRRRQNAETTLHTLHLALEQTNRELTAIATTLDNKTGKPGKPKTDPQPTISPAELQEAKLQQRKRQLQGGGYGRT